jgi:hypothetical protein
VDQPAAASCFGTLIDDDLVVTAGHCAFSQRMCQSFLYVFHYYYAAAGQMAAITSEDVFSCREVVVQRLTTTTNHTWSSTTQSFASIGRPLPAMCPRT